MEKRHNLSKSDVVEEIPLACSDENAAVEFLEKQRWGNTPACVKCGSVDVYKMADAKTGKRNRRYLWRCHDCKEQFTVRIGTVYEESRIELRHWCYAFWRACTSKKGVAALEIKRHCQISYKSALFMMNRIRFAMAPNPGHPKLSGTAECDEMYVGARKPRYKGVGFRGRGTQNKVPVFVAGNAKVNFAVASFPISQAKRSTAQIREEVERQAWIITDEFTVYKGLKSEFPAHETVNHGTRE